MNIDLISYLSRLENYVVLRRSDIFPEISIGGDIDILVEDREFAEKILVEHFLQADVDNYAVQVDQREAHTHIDLLSNGILFFRFDLIDSFAFLKKIHVRNGFSAHVLANKLSATIGEETVFFPSLLDDMLIRYLEYIEYFEAIPTKEKHLAYVMEHAEASWPTFIAHVHRFTKLVHDAYVENPNKQVAQRARAGMRQRFDPIIRLLPLAVKEPLKKVYHALKRRR